jgi:hypothetical protein
MASGEKHRQMGKTLTQRERIFSPSTPPVKVEQLIAWPRREKRIYFPPVEIRRYCHKKRLCPGEKIWFTFPLAIFSFRYTACENRRIIAWPKGEKIKTQGEKISYIFPQLDFCALFGVTIEIIGGKIWYYVPYCLHFITRNTFP